MPETLNKQERQEALPVASKVAILWFLIDGCTHLSLELGYALITIFYGGARFGPTTGIIGYLCDIWRLYGKADPRWTIFAQDILALEIVTVFMMGPFAFWAAYAIYTRKPYRHLLQFAIGVCELYGTWMTFGPEWLHQAVYGVTELRGAAWGTLGDMILWWIYLLFMNGLWVLIPGILCWESGKKIVGACEQSKVETNRKNEQLGISDNGTIASCSDPLGVVSQREGWHGWTQSLVNSFASGCYSGAAVTILRLHKPCQ